MSGEHHLLVEDVGGVGDGGQLQLLLGAKVGIETALAHPGVLGEIPDREAVEPVHCRQSGGRVENRLAAAVAVGAGAACGFVSGLSVHA